MTEPDEDASPYGASPASRARNYFHRQPAMGAVVVEFLFLLIFCNEWMLNHVVVPWEASASPIRRGLAPGIGAFQWTFTPVLEGYNWIWAGYIVHALGWLFVTYLLVRVSARTREVGARFIATVGSVMIAAVAALLAQRLVSYPDLARLQEAVTQTRQAGPGLVPWLFFGTLPGASILLAVLVGAIASIASGQLALVADDEADDRDAEDNEHGAVEA
ncbi:MAG: hypothetical protein ABI808_06985 [Pseudonocardiales bacterium]